MKTLSIISSVEFTTQSCFHQEVQGLASIEAFLGGDFYRPARRRQASCFFCGIFTATTRGSGLFLGGRQKSDVLSIGQLLRERCNNHCFWVEILKINSSATWYCTNSPVHWDIDVRQSGILGADDQLGDLWPRLQEFHDENWIRHQHDVLLVHDALLHALFQNQSSQRRGIQ